MAEALIELEQVLRSKKVTMTLEEANLLSACKSKALDNFTYGIGLSSGIVWAGIFIAMQRKLIACGMKMACLGMVLRLIAGPALMAVSSLVVGLRGDVLKIPIMQAALPQAITAFIFMKEYGLHASVLSTAKVFQIHSNYFHAQCSPQLLLV
ncbi:auxin efflux carrier component 5-like [Syzygium oleosum]|uniref:auxin efflux carrier component 5-like n=1 Tax=Syzygium oleosum TaxID=219896 RepID=UPI0024BA2274|nr:auxin efflux carrier component 5-like [Syzygium oleosum]